MKKPANPISLCLFVACASLAACVIESDPDPTEPPDVVDPEPPTPYATISATWQASCPDNAVVELVAVADGSEDAIVDIFYCDDQAGVTAPLELNNYLVFINMVDVNDGTLLAQSNSFEVLLDTDKQVADLEITTFPIDAGFFSLAWTLADAGGTTISCEQFGATNVDIVATIAGTQDAIVEVFPCADGSAISGEIPVGDYIVVVDALNSNDEALAITEAVDKQIEHGNHIVDLGIIDFQQDPI